MPIGLRPVQDLYLFKASRELLQFMHWSATVSDTVTDFQDLQCRTLKTSFDLFGLPLVTSTCIRLPLMPVQTSRNPCCKTSLDSVDLYATPKLNAPVCDCLWCPGRLQGISGAKQLSRNNELVISLLRVIYLVITS